MGNFYVSSFKNSISFIGFRILAHFTLNMLCNMLPNIYVRAGKSKNIHTMHIDNQLFCAHITYNYALITHDDV